MRATVFALLFVVIQACYGQDFPPQMIQSIETCIDTLKLDRNVLIEASKQVQMPEDDEDMLKFFECYSKDLGLVDAQGTVVPSKILEITEARLKIQMKNIPDGDAKAHHIATSAVEHCKDSPQDGRLGLVAIRHRNCIRSFISNPQLLHQ